MENIFVKHISEIIYRICLSNGLNINTLSRISEIPAETVRDILLNMISLPFGGITLEAHGLGLDEDIEELPEELLDEKIIWKINSEKMDKIPVENLEAEERVVLARLVEGALQRDFFERFCTEVGAGNVILVKGTSSETDEIFKCRHYMNIRKAFASKRMLLITANCEAGELIKAEAVPAGMVFHSEKQQWYIILVLQNGEPRSVDIDDIIELRLLDKSASLRNFDLREYLRHCFDLDAGESLQVSVIFDNYGNIPVKIRRRLGGRGVITESEQHIEFSGTLSGIDEFLKWVLSFGAAARITNPQWLAQRQMEEWRRTVKNYEKLEQYRSMIKE